VRGGSKRPELNELLRRHGLITVKRKYHCFAVNRFLLSASRSVPQPFRSVLNLLCRPTVPLLAVLVETPYCQITLAIRI
jgi:hypothetical protein